MIEEDDRCSEKTVVLEQEADPKDNQFCLILPHHDPERFNPFLKSVEEARPTIDDLLQRVQKGVQSLEDTYYKQDRRTATVQNLKIALTHFDTAELQKNTIPFLYGLIRDTPNILKRKVLLMRRRERSEVSLTKREVGCLMANVMFGLNCPQFFTNRLPSFKFIYGSKTVLAVQKLKFLIQYFITLAKQQNCLHHNLIFVRESIPRQSWKDSGQPILSPAVTPHFYQGLEEAFVDFANKNIGGGVFGKGAAQEEILFLCHPEAMVSTLLNEELADGECLYILGLQKYSTEIGYSENLRFRGPFVDTRQIDAFDKRRSCLIAIDATDYYSDLRDQYSAEMVQRELDKAFVGFRGNEYLPEDLQFSTGKWGCGVFKGEPELKLLVQLMAGAKAGRKLRFHGYQPAESEFILTVLEGRTVKEVFELVTEYRFKGRPLSLWKWILKYAV